MTLKAMFNYVVVKIDLEAPTEHPSGLALPAKQNEFPSSGIITSVGPECKVPEMIEGKHVLIPPTGVGQLVTEGLENYLVLLDHEIYGVIN